MFSSIGVADCSQASQTGDARDKFFAQPIPEFDPRASSLEFLRASGSGVASLIEFEEFRQKS